MSTPPLYKLAEQHLLPNVQIMDNKTLEWIKSNQPQDCKFSFSNYHYSVRQALLSNLRITEQELLSIVDKLGTPIFPAHMRNGRSLHGTLHALRVAILAGLVALESSLNPNEAIIAGLFHDLARTNDKGDEGHGLRSAVLFVDRYEKKMAPQTVQKIQDAIARHEEKMSGTVANLVTILQMADALDRYRLPKIKWWPDVGFMTRQPTDILFCLSYYLVYESEKNLLEGIKPWDAFDSAILSVERELRNG